MRLFFKTNDYINIVLIIRYFFYGCLVTKKQFLFYIASFTDNLISIANDIIVEK